MKLQEVKEIADRCVEQARSFLMRDGVLSPVAISLGVDGDMTPVMLNIGSEKEKETLPGQLKDLSLMSAGLIVIIDSNVKETDVKTDAPVKLTGSLKSAPDASEAIVCMVYVKDATSIRRILYKRANPDAVPIFFDLGWLDIGKGEWKEGRLANPFDI
jgi:hypothetical protein